MKVTSVLSVVYYILLIILILYILSNTIQWDNVWPSIKDNESNIDLIDMSEELDRPKKPKPKFEYGNKHNVNIKPGIKTIDTTNNIDFESFKNIVYTKEFLVLFKQSLTQSYREKRNIYNKLLIETKSNLGKKGMFELDSNHTRIEKQLEEIKQIQNMLNYRLEHINIRKIKNDFRAIIQDSKHGFSSLIGRKDVKDMIARRIYTFAKNPLVFIKGFQNMAIYGKSGVGKTKLAETIGYIYAKTGILVRRKFRKVSKQEFTSPYVDESASLTRGVVMSCLEGVLFIDEAYGLTQGGILGSIGGTHREEAIIELVNVLDNYRGLGVVMVGGYEDKMERQFMTSNEGMKRRFPTVIRLGDYNEDQLTDLLIDFLIDTHSEMTINQKDANYMYSVIINLNQKGVFDRQAGDMQNMATEIVNALYGSYLNWGSSFENNQKIINEGVNTFLINSKGRKEHID